MPAPGESCLVGPCPAWGECRPIKTGRRVGPPSLPAPPSCWPGQASPGSNCAKLSILLRKESLSPGTSVELLCRRLRRLIADPRRLVSVVLLCDLKPGDNDTIEVTIFSDAAAMAARDLGEALSRPIGRPLALASVLEVKVETALPSSDGIAGSNANANGNGYLALLGGAIVAILMIALLFSFWYLRTARQQQLQQQHCSSGLTGGCTSTTTTTTVNSEATLHRHRSDLDEKSNNLQNEENLRRYANPLKELATVDTEPRISVVRPMSGGTNGTLSLGSTNEEGLEMMSEEGRHKLPPLYKPPCAEMRNNTASFSYEEVPHKPYSKPRLPEPTYNNHNHQHHQHLFQQQHLHHRHQQQQQQQHQSVNSQQQTTNQLHQILTVHV